MKKRKVVIGVDLGGTKIMTGVIDLNGKVLGKPIKKPTGARESSDKIVKRITDSIDTVIKMLELSKDEILGIGIGSTGPIDSEKGIILDCPQLPTMQYFPLKKIIQNYYQLPVVMNNDANSLILAENVFGVAKNNTNVVGFTLGTGIGCAILFDKKIFNGATGTAGEVWTSPYNGKTIEDYISGEGVKSIYKKMSGVEKESVEVLHLAKNGDVNALKTWEEFGKHLAIAIAWTVNIIDPEIVVLGGSIAKAADFFLPSLEKHLRKQICTVPAEKMQIKLAHLGDYAGFIGAGALVLQAQNVFNNYKTTLL